MHMKLWSAVSIYTTLFGFCLLGINLIDAQSEFRLNSQEICRTDTVDSVDESCNILMSPNGNQLTKEGNSNLLCLVGGAAGKLYGLSNEQLKSPDPIANCRYRDLVNTEIGTDQNYEASCFRKAIGSNALYAETGGAIGSDASSGGIGKDGVSFIYPTQSGGFTWYLGPNGFDAHLEKGGGSTFKKLEKNKDGSFTADASRGSARFNLNPPTDYEDGGNAIGKCRMNFTESVKRGYTWKLTDLRHVEFTGFFKVDTPLMKSGIYIRGPSNHHVSQPDCCENANYDLEVSANGSDATAKFTKQAPDKYAPDPAGTKRINPPVNLVGHGWFGLKYVHSIISDNPDDPKVLLQGFINLDGNGKTWTKIAETIDHNGYGWGKEGAMCGGKPDQVLAFGSPRMVFKWYSGDVDFKKISLREINQVPASAYS